MSRLPVVADIQKDFVDGALDSPETRVIVPNVLGKVRAYQDVGNEVVFALDTHLTNCMDTMERKKLPVVHCVKGTPGWELVPKLRGVPGTHFEKCTFGSRELADYVARGQHDLVELAGLCTDIYVISDTMLIKTAAPDTPTQVDGSYCTGVAPQSHHNTLSAMGMCHIDVIQTWERPRPCHGQGCGLGIRGILNMNDKHFVITVERQYGNGGRLTGKRLAEEPDIHFYDERILRMTSETSATGEQCFRLANEKAGNSMLYRVVTSMKPELTGPDKDDPNITSPENLLRFRSSVIRRLAASETCIIISCCGNHVLQDQMDNLVRILVYADTVTRIRRVMDVDKMDETEALCRMRRVGKERTEYHHYFTGRERVDIESYDLPINASRIDYDQMIQLIKDYLKLKGFL